MWHFADPWFLLLLALIPWFIRRYRRRVREGSGSLRFASTIAMEGIRPSWTIRARHALFAADIVAFGLVVLAMARPQRGIEEEEVLTEGVDIVIALDASGSMAAEDFSPRVSRPAPRRVFPQLNRLAKSIALHSSRKRSR